MERTHSAPGRDVDGRSVAEQVFDALTAQPTVGFALLDADLRYVAVNERLAEINGLAVADHV
ncbi:MAG TPA: hypothetical protein VE781_10340, partial [Kineosporiaceae bacterium]|nr:hypothetical protein [Kineosporiaceae bacterium]